MAPPYKPLVEIGATFSSPPGVGGLVGETPATLATEVNIGSLSLRERLEAEMCTLILTRTDIETVTPLHPLNDVGRLLAHITYGLGTASDSIFVDWNVGSSISVPSGVGTVTVNAVQTGIALDGTKPGMITRVLLTAQLAAGARSSLGAPTLSYLVDVPAGGLAPAIVRVPNRAKRVIVGSPKGILSDISVRLLIGPSGNYFQLNQAADSLVRTQGVDLPGPCDIVQLNSLLGETAVPVFFVLDG